MTRYKLVVLTLLSCVCLAACNQSEQKIEPTIQHNIPIKVAIIYMVGGAQAVASEDFYLLNRNAVEVWKDRGLLNAEKLRVPGVTKEGFPTEDQVFRVYFSTDQYRVSQKKPSEFHAAVTPFILKAVTTDFEGNATFEGVPEGEYYIYGFTETRSGYAVWSYKVSTNQSKTILLDNKNAIYSW